MQTTVQAVRDLAGSTLHYNVAYSQAQASVELLNQWAESVGGGPTWGWSRQDMPTAVLVAPGAT